MNNSDNTAATAEVQPFVGQFAAKKDELPGASLPWLAELRDAALQGFASRGFPTRRDESWKYTNLRPLARIPFAPAERIEVGAAPVSVLPAESRPYRVVIANGRFSPERSDVDGVPAGVRLGSLADLLRNEPDLLKPWLGSTGQADDAPMLALNTAFMSDGMVLMLEEGMTLDRPVELIYLGTAGGEAAVAHPRSLIVARKGSTATVVEHHIGQGEGTYLSNGATEIFVGDDATLHHYKLQEEGAETYHLHANRIHVGTAAVYDNFVVSLGGRLARNQIDVEIRGERADVRLNGAYIARGRQHLDHTSRIDHLAPNSISRQVYKGVLDDRARGVFQGHIVVAREAQKTDGHQLNRALMLSDGAEIDSKPMLEIYADDVKCSHGATAGDLEKNALFYLRARGIPEAEARGLLIAAFLGEVIDDLPVPEVREVFRARVERQLFSQIEEHA